MMLRACENNLVRFERVCAFPSYGLLVVVQVSKMSGKREMLDKAQVRYFGGRLRQ